MADTRRPLTKRILGTFPVPHIALGGMAIIPLVLMALPASFFDNGQPMCLSVILFDMECYNCGMTRAFQHLIHFEYTKAMEFNPRVVIVFPLVAFFYVRGMWKLWKISRAMNRQRSATA